MSSTNRSNARDEHVADYYVTPQKDVELFLKKAIDVIPDFEDKLLFGYIVDPCGGGNSEIKDENGIKELYHPMTYPTVIKKLTGCDTDTYDIREDSLAEHKCDYLTTKLDYKPDVVITNPPFNQAVSIIEKAIDDVEDDGYVIMLLRLNFFGSKERESFFAEYMPEYCFVHHVRIGFLDKKDSNGYVILDNDGNAKRGSTDSIEYCHMVFHKGVKPEFTKLYYI